MNDVLQEDGISDKDVINLYLKAYFELVYLVYKDISEDLQREIAEMQKEVNLL